MKSKNICKFVPEATLDTLAIHNFVCERSALAMRERANLTFHKAVLVTQGSGAFWFDGFCVRGTAGDLLFGFVDEEFWCEPEPDCEYIYISFGGARAQTLFRRFGIHKCNRHFGGFAGLIPMWLESVSRASQSSVDLASESALLYAFSKFSSDEKEKGDIVNKVVCYLEESFTRVDLSLGVVAKELGYNEKYLSHLFKQKVGIGFAEYLRTVRIKHAVMLFEHGLDSVKTVAFLSGFADPLYFSKVFKSAVGISPKDYKKKM